MLDKFLSANGFVALVIAVLTTLAVTSLFASAAFVISPAVFAVTVIDPLILFTVRASGVAEVTLFTTSFAEIVTTPFLF